LVDGVILGLLYFYTPGDTIAILVALLGFINFGQRHLDSFAGKRIRRFAVLEAIKMNT